MNHPVTPLHPLTGLGLLVALLTFVLHATGSAAEDGGVGAGNWDLKLSGSSHQRIGRLEVKPANTTDLHPFWNTTAVWKGSYWGTVCSSILDNRLRVGVTSSTARGLCGLLGLPSTYGMSIPSFPDGRGAILMSNLSCSESADGLKDLNDCSFTASAITEKANDCGHVLDVGLSCLNEEDQIPNPLFNVTFRYDRISADTIVARLKEFMQMEDDVDVSIIQTWKQTFNPKWGQLVFQFVNLTVDPSVADWMLARTFHEYSDSFLKYYLEIYNVFSNIDRPEGMMYSDVSRNPTAWWWRLQHPKKVPQPLGTGSGVDSSQTTTTGLTTTTGRVELKPGSTADWGTICDKGGEFTLTDATAVCNSVPTVKSTGRTPWTVLVLPYYGGGYGPIYLSGVECQSVPPINFLNSCLKYQLATPTNRGANTCGHESDVGVNCQADTTVSDVHTMFHAYVRPPTTAVGLLEDMAKVLNVMGHRIHLDSWMNDPVTQNLTVVTFHFTDPLPDDLHRATKFALDEVLLFMRPEGLLLLLQIEQLLFEQQPVTGAMPTPVPIDNPTPRDLFAITMSDQISNGELLYRLANYLHTQPFLLITNSRTEFPGTQGRMVRVELVVQGPPTPQSQIKRVNDGLLALVGHTTAYPELGISGVTTVDDSNITEPASSNKGKTILLLLAVVLCVILCGYMMVQRARYNSMEDAQYRAMLDGEENPSTTTEETMAARHRQQLRRNIRTEEGVELRSTNGGGGGDTAAVDVTTHRNGTSAANTANTNGSRPRNATPPPKTGSVSTSVGLQHAVGTTSPPADGITPARDVEELLALDAAHNGSVAQLGRSTDGTDGPNSDESFDRQSSNHTP